MEGLLCYERSRHALGLTPPSTHTDANGNEWQLEPHPVWVCQAIGQWVAPRPQGLQSTSRLAYAELPLRAGNRTLALACIGTRTHLPMEVSMDAPGGVQGMRDAAVSLYAHEVDHALERHLGDPHDREPGRCHECGRTA